MQFRLRGDKQRPNAAEINKWNRVADQQLRGELRKLPPVTLQNYDPNARIVRAQNISGADRATFDCMSLDNLIWDLEADGSADVVFTLVAADPDKAPAILIEPIEDDGFGRVVIDGPAIAKIESGSTSHRWAVPQASTHSLEPVASGSIKLLQAPSASATKIVPVILHAGGAGILDLRTNGKNLEYTFSSDPEAGDWEIAATFDMRLSGTSLQFTIDGGDTWHTWHTVGTTCPEE
jgi:hypothetical protein